MKSQTITLIGYLLPQERLKLRLWLDNDLHCPSLKVRKLGHYILEKISELQVGLIEKKTLFHFVSGDIPYNELRINNLLSNLQEVVLQFITFVRRSNDQFANLLDQSLELVDRKAMHFVKRSLRKIDQGILANSQHSYEALFKKEQKLQLEDILHLSEKPHDYSPALQHQMDTLDEYYLVKKLRLACEMQNRSRLIKEQYTIRHLNHLLPLVQITATSNPCISLYFLCLKMLTNRRDQEFENLFKELKISSAFFPEQELRVLYGYLLNFGIDKINSGQSIYYQKIFSIYEAMITSRLIFSNEYISEWTFKNIVTTGIRIKKYKWTKDFIERYKANLPQKDYDNAVAYNLASLYFAENDYSASLQTLLGVEFTDATYFIGAKIIQLKSYYILKESEAFFSLIDSFKKYVSRNKKLSANKILSNQNFLSMARKLYKLRSTKKLITKKSWDQKSKDFGRKLEKLSPIANKDWLKTCYDELN